MGFVDIHHHLLYGIDDGPKDQGQMERMLQNAAADGISEIAVTPHIVPGVEPFDYAQYRKALYAANEYCRSHRLGIRVYGGAEILYTENTCRMLREGEIPTIAGTDCVLVEFSPDVRYDVMKEALSRLHSYGYRPIIAHVERYQCLRMWPRRTLELKEQMEVFYQANCSTLVLKGRYFEKMFVRRLMKQRMLDALATDAHDDVRRVVRMKLAYQAVEKQFGENYARRLTSGWMLEE